jgi:hypothetical protein
MNVIPTTSELQVRMLTGRFLAFCFRSAPTAAQLTAMLDLLADLPCDPANADMAEGGRLLALYAEGARLRHPAAEEAAPRLAFQSLFGGRAPRRRPPGSRSTGR